MSFIKFTDKFPIPQNLIEFQQDIICDNFGYSRNLKQNNQNFFTYCEKTILVMCASCSIDFYIVLFGKNDDYNLPISATGALRSPGHPSWTSYYRQVISAELKDLKDAIIDVENRILVIPSTLLAWNY